MKIVHALKQQSMKNIKIIITSKHPDYEVSQTYVERLVNEAIAGNPSRKISLDPSDNSFIIHPDDEVMAEPIVGAIYEKYYVVDGKTMSVSELPEQLAQELTVTVPTSFETLYETDEHTVREIWEK